MPTNKNAKEMVEAATTAVLNLFPSDTIKGVHNYDQLISPAYPTQYNRYVTFEDGEVWAVSIAKQGNGDGCELHTFTQNYDKVDKCKYCSFAKDNPNAHFVEEVKGNAN